MSDHDSEQHQQLEQLEQLEAEAGFISVTSENLQSTIPFTSSVRDSLRRHLLLQSRRAMQEVSRLQQKMPPVLVFVRTLQVEIDQMGILADLNLEFENLAALLNGMIAYYDILSEDLALYERQLCEVDHISYEHFCTLSRSNT